jgi:hypothetical protein
MVNGAFVLKRVEQSKEMLCHGCGKRFKWYQNWVHVGGTRSVLGKPYGGVFYHTRCEPATLPRESR